MKKIKFKNPFKSVKRKIEDKVERKIREKTKATTVKYLQKNGVELSGLKMGISLNDVRLTLTDTETGKCYEGKIVINGNNITTSKFKRV